MATSSMANPDRTMPTAGSQPQAAERPDTDD